MNVAHWIRRNKEPHGEPEQEREDGQHKKEASGDLPSCRRVGHRAKCTSGLKPGNVCGDYGGAEAVPLMDCAAYEGEEATANAEADSLRE
jgi:hypothetical protein